MGRVTERFVDESSRFHIVKQQDCEKIIQAIKEVPDMVCQSKLKSASTRYLGSVPNVVAVAWAKEWGVRLYSREWQEKVQQRLKHDPNWSALRVRY